MYFLFALVVVGHACSTFDCEDVAAAVSLLQSHLSLGASPRSHSASIHADQNENFGMQSLNSESNTIQVTPTSHAQTPPKVVVGDAFGFRRHPYLNVIQAQSPPVAHDLEKQAAPVSHAQTPPKVVGGDAFGFRRHPYLKLLQAQAPPVADVLKKQSSQNASSYWSNANTYDAMKHHATTLAPLAAVVTAMVTMLTIGGDDVIWLLPFFVGKDRVVKTVAYLIYMEVVVLVSWMIKALMKVVETRHPDAPIRKIIQVVSSVLLSIFCAYLFYEWWNEEADDEDSESESRNESEHMNSENSSVNEGRARAESGKSNEIAKDAQGNAKKGCDVHDKSSFSAAEAHLVQTPHNQHHERLGLWMLFAVSMVGSLDNFAVYSYFLFSDMMTAWELFLGVLIASTLIAAVAHGALAFKPVLKIVEKLPLWVIFACLCIWSYSEIIRD
jgi:cadmium resistance protein CadD (predicted permease)